MLEAISLTHAELKVSACCHKFSFRFITGKDRYEMLNKSDLSTGQVPFAENHL